MQGGYPRRGKHPLIPVAAGRALEVPGELIVRVHLVLRAAFDDEQVTLPQPLRHRGVEIRVRHVQHGGKQDLQLAAGALKAKNRGAVASPG